jgi:hypothetical protein
LGQQLKSSFFFPDAIIAAGSTPSRRVTTSLCANNIYSKGFSHGSGSTDVHSQYDILSFRSSKPRKKLAILSRMCAAKCGLFWEKCCARTSVYIRLIHTLRHLAPRPLPPFSNLINKIREKKRDGGTAASVYVYVSFRFSRYLLEREEKGTRFSATKPRDNNSRRQLRRGARTAVHCSCAH